MYYCPVSNVNFFLANELVKSSAMAAADSPMAVKRKRNEMKSTSTKKVKEQVNISLIAHGNT